MASCLFWSTGGFLTGCLTYNICQEGRSTYGHLPIEIPLPAPSRQLVKRLTSRHHFLLVGVLFFVFCFEVPTSELLDIQETDKFANYSTSQTIAPFVIVSLSTLTYHDSYLCLSF